MNKKKISQFPFSPASSSFQLSLDFEERVVNQKILYYSESMPRLEEKFEDIIGEIKQKDPFSSVVGVVPSSLVRKDLNKKLRMPGIKLFNFKEFAMEIGAKHLLCRGLTSIPRQGENLLAESALKTILQPGNLLYPFLEGEGLLSSFLSLLKDFRQGGLDQFPDIEHIVGTMKNMGGVFVDEERLTTVFRLINAYRQGIRKKFFDVEDILKEAGSHAGEFETIFSEKRLFLYGFFQMDEAQKSLISSLSEYLDIISFSPVMESSYISQENLEWYRQRGFVLNKIQLDYKSNKNIDILKLNIFNIKSSSFSPLGDSSVKIFSCCNIREEIREICREIIKTAGEEGIPFENMAIILRNPDKYQEEIRDALEDLGIPGYYHGGISPLKTSSGIGMKLLLDLIGSGLPRFGVMEFLSRESVDFSSFFPDYFPNISQWDRISREAGIRGGIEEWNLRLKKLLAKNRTNQEQSHEKGEDPMEYNRTIRDIEKLLEFIKIFNHDISKIPEYGIWQDYINKIIELFKKYIRQDKYYPLIIKNIKLLSKMDSLPGGGSGVKFQDFKRFVQQQLTSRWIPWGKFRNGGVNIITFQGSLALRFDAVFIPGMIMGEIPALGKDNPLMLDFEKELFNTGFNWQGQLPKRSRQGDEDFIYLSHIIRNCNKKIVFSYPRTSSEDSSPVSPSPFIMDIGKAIAGREFFYDNFEEIPGFFSFSPLYLKFPPRGIPLSFAELRWKKVEEAVNKKDPFIVRELENLYPCFSSLKEYFRQRYASSHFSEYEGFLSSIKIKEKINEMSLGINEPLSPSFLEEYFHCPYRFFLNRLLGIKKLDSPENIKTISSLDRGSLYHRIFQSFYTKLQENSMLPLHPEMKERYLQIIKQISVEIIAEFENLGVTGSYISWFEKKTELEENMTRFLDNELNLIENNSFIPSRFELSFGDDQNSQPVPLPLNRKRIFHCRGRIDRIDISPDGGSMAIIDYKTGGSQGYKDNSLSGGKTLQLPLYLTSLPRIFKDLQEPEKSFACYYFATVKGKFARKVFHGEYLKQQEEQLKTLINIALESIEKGIFSPRPDVPNNCPNCDYKNICTKDIKFLFKIKEKNYPDPHLLTLEEQFV